MRVLQFHSGTSRRRDPAPGCNMVPLHLCFRRQLLVAVESEPFLPTFHEFRALFQPLTLRSKYFCCLLAWVPLLHLCWTLGCYCLLLALSPLFVLHFCPIKTLVLFWRWTMFFFKSLCYLSVLVFGIENVHQSLDLCSQLDWKASLVQLF